MAVHQGARRRSPLPLGLDALTGGQGGRRSTGTGARRTAANDAVAPGKTRGAASRVATRASGASRAERASRRRTRPSSIGMAIVAIVIVFSAAFLSLSQSVRVAATGYDIVRLISEHDRLDAIRQDLRSDVDRLRSEPAIRKQALDAGLGQLGGALIISAR